MNVSVVARSRLELPCDPPISGRSGYESKALTLYQLYKPIDLKLAFNTFSNLQSLPVLFQLLFSAHCFFLFKKYSQ
jgi:hypothetical protein